LAWLDGITGERLERIFDAKSLIWIVRPRLDARPAPLAHADAAHVAAFACCYASRRVLRVDRRKARTGLLSVLLYLGSVIATLARRATAGVGLKVM